MVSGTWEAPEPLSARRSFAERWLLFAAHSRRLPLILAGVGMLLTAPTLLLGKLLDDFFHEYFASGLPGADKLVPSRGSFFTIASGDPQANHDLVEQGLAPFWTLPTLRLNFFRPITTFTHWVEYSLYPGAPWLMHLQNLLWFGACIYAATLLYRGVIGKTPVAALAAFLFTVDHTHGLPVGWIANRNALIAFAFAALALVHHDRAAREDDRRARWLGPVLFVAGLLGGEIALGAWGYLLAHAVVLDERPVAKRIASLLPYAVATVGWRVVYSALGYGGFGSGVYVDPVHEPGEFLTGLVTRVPVYFLGLFAVPPAEASYFFGPHAARVLVYLGVAVMVALFVTVRPLLRLDRATRYWALGMVLSLLPACTASPHNRLLFLPSLGAMALIAKPFLDTLEKRAWVTRNGVWSTISRPFLGLVAGLHLFFSPALLPLAACNVAVTSSITKDAVPSALRILERTGGRDLIVVNAPDYYYSALIRVEQRLAKTETPEHIRLLSIGSVDMQAERVDARTLRVDYQGGLLTSPRTWLYRGARFPMTAGETIRLDGLTIEVTRVTDDGRPASATFTFDEPLDSSRFTWVTWNGSEYVEFTPPHQAHEVAHVSAVPMPFEFGS